MALRLKFIYTDQCSILPKTMNSTRQLFKTTMRTLIMKISDLHYVVYNKKQQLTLIMNELLAKFLSHIWIRLFSTQCHYIVVSVVTADSVFLHDFLKDMLFNERGCCANWVRVSFLNGVLLFIISKSYFAIMNFIHSIIMILILPHKSSKCVSCMFVFTDCNRKYCLYRKHCTFVWTRIFKKKNSFWFI